MTIREAIELFNRLMNQPFEEELLIMWLAELDGMAIREIFAGYDESPAGDDWEPYVPGDDLETVLLIPAPYDSVYLDYLKMKTDAWNKESSYNNSVKAFNNAYMTFGDNWRRTHKTQQPFMRF